MKDLTKIEETVLLAIWRLKDGAYGVTIRDQINKVSGRKFMYNALYSILDQLVQKGYITKRYGEPTPIRGGKRKIFFNLTESGLQSLHNSFKEKMRVWDGVTEDTFLGNMPND